MCHGANTEMQIIHLVSRLVNIQMSDVWMLTVDYHVLLGVLGRTK